MFASEIIVEPCWTPMKSWSNLISTTISRQRVLQFVGEIPLNPPWNPIKKHIKSDEPITHHEINHYIPCPHFPIPPFFYQFFTPPIPPMALNKPSRLAPRGVGPCKTHGSQGAVESGRHGRRMVFEWHLWGNDYWYPLVMTNSLPWKDPPFLRTVNHLFRLGPISMGHGFHGELLNNQMVCVYWYVFKKYLKTLKLDWWLLGYWKINGNGFFPLIPSGKLT